jgi:hypothetical protein
MTKQELVHIAKVMYDLQEYCRFIDELNNHEECNGCTFLFDHVKCRLIALTKDNKIPCDNWNITKADIARLERESNDVGRVHSVSSKRIIRAKAKRTKGTTDN